MLRRLNNGLNGLLTGWTGAVRGAFGHVGLLLTLVHPGILLALTGGNRIVFEQEARHQSPGGSGLGGQRRRRHSRYKPRHGPLEGHLRKQRVNGRWPLVPCMGTGPVARLWAYTCWWQRAHRQRGRHGLHVG